MSIRRKVGRFRAVIAAGVLAIAALVIPSSALPAPTQPAIAPAAHPAAAQQDACTPISPNGLTWGTRFNERGVTLCQGTNGFASNAFVQIIDLSAGAKVRLVTEECVPCRPFSDTARLTDKRFNVRTAAEWFTWAESNVNYPDAGRLFSTSNASFFTDASGAPSAVSLGAKYHIRDDPEFCAYLGGPCTVYVDWSPWGWAFAHHEDPAWDSPKRALILEDVNYAGAQGVYVQDFPTHFTDTDVDDLIGWWDEPWRFDGDFAVGFTPDFDGGTGLAPRTYMGVTETGGFAFILNTGWDNPLTVTQAQNILKSFGSDNEIQLDGGGSTQLYADTTDFECCFESLIDRKVPNSLAVYLGP